MSPVREPPDPVGPSPPSSPRKTEEPDGLLGLLLAPLRTALGAGLRLFAALVAGGLAAVLGRPPFRPPPDEARSDEPSP